jgi:formylmethanofuran dehydrogenase subunit B
MTESTRVEHVTCLGCGCGCDDVTVTVTDNRISEVSSVCSLGRAWFGDGSIPLEIRNSGRTATLDEALRAAAEMLLRARGRLLVFIGTDLTSQAQRIALSLADQLHATVDTGTSPTAAEGLLTAQRRGRTGATLGEVRNRGDVILFWGMDPAQQYPRFMARYVEPAGTHVPEGRRGRTIIGVSVGSDLGPKGADISLTLGPEQEIAALSFMRASLQGAVRNQPSPALADAVEVAARLAKARYAVLVHDAEPTSQPRNSLRAEGLIALAQALNGPTRAALISLRAGGNRVGAEAVLTWQTGYPLSVDYSRGYPLYEPARRGVDRLGAGGFQAALVLGSVPAEDTLTKAFGHLSTTLIGPRASQAPFATEVAIDTGIAGIHEGGTAYRADEVPLRLRPPLSGQRSTLEVLGRLSDLVRAGSGSTTS